MEKINNKNNNFDVEGKVVIITGASGGIGFTLANEFINLGAKVSMVDKKDFSIDELIQKNRDIKFKPLFIKADLTKEEDLERVVQDTKKEWGRIDILVNCAGVNIRKKIEDYTEADWDFIMGVNLKSIYNLTKKVAKIMQSNHYGKIINMSSMQGLICWNGVGKFSLAPYCASKAGLISLTKAFALELAKDNITVNAICPAFVDTELIKSMKEDRVLYQDMISRTPLGRIANASELIGPVLFLASDASSYVTGHALLVDGGWTIQ